MRKTIQQSPTAVFGNPTAKPLSKNEQKIWNGRTVAIAGGVLTLAVIGVVTFLYSKSGNSPQTMPDSPQTMPDSPQITATQQEELSKGLIPVTMYDLQGGFGTRLAFSRSFQDSVIAGKSFSELLSLKGLFSNVLSSPRYAVVSPLQGYSLTGEFVFSAVMDLIVGSALLSTTPNQQYIIDKICSVFPKTCEEFMNNDEFSPLKKAPEGVSRQSHEHVEHRRAYLESLLVREYKFYENECFTQHPHRDTILAGIRLIGNYLFDPIIGTGALRDGVDRGIYHLYHYAAEVPKFAKASLHMVKNVGGISEGLRFILMVKMYTRRIPWMGFLTDSIMMGYSLLQIERRDYVCLQLVKKIWP